MILLVGNTKGGVGKSTLAVQIATARALKGSEVWLIDGDRQGTSAASIANRQEAGRQPGIACAQYAEGKELRGQLLQQKGKWDDIIIDAGGRDSTALRAALILADVLLVPFAPRSYDVWALDDMTALVQETRSVRDGLQVYAMLNQADPWENSTDNKEAVEIVQGYPEFHYLDTPVRRRKPISTASGAGMSVSEMPAVDQKAKAEIDRLVEVLFR